MAPACAGARGECLAVETSAKASRVANGGRLNDQRSSGSNDNGAAVIVEKKRVLDDGVERFDFPFGIIAKERGASVQSVGNIPGTKQGGK